MPQDMIKEYEEKANELAGLALDLVMAQKRAEGKAISPVSQARDLAVVLLVELVKLTIMLFKSK